MEIFTSEELSLLSGCPVDIPLSPRTTALDVFDGLFTEDEVDQLINFLVTMPQNEECTTLLVKLKTAIPLRITSYRLKDGIASISRDIISTLK